MSVLRDSRLDYYDAQLDLMAYLLGFFDSIGGHADVVKRLMATTKEIQQKKMGVIKDGEPEP